MNQSHTILIERYTQLIKAVRPDINPIKNKSGSLELSHALWMLNKMNDPQFINKTSNDAWITWIQASLHSNGIIDIRNEIAITRDIINQLSYKCID